MNKYALMKKPERTTLIALLAGLLFGTGLVLSGMTTPANILAFLDIAGDWDPSLMIVMASAIAVAVPAFFYVRRHQRTVTGTPVSLSNKRPIDKPLIIGSAIFGLGWGLSGICPGPGLVIAVSGSVGALVFILAVSAGMWLAPRLQDHLNSHPMISP